MLFIYYVFPFSCYSKSMLTFSFIELHYITEVVLVGLSLSGDLSAESLSWFNTFSVIFLKKISTFGILKPLLNPKNLNICSFNVVLLFPYTLFTPLFLVFLSLLIVYFQISCIWGHQCFFVYSALDTFTVFLFGLVSFLSQGFLFDILVALVSLLNLSGEGFSCLSVPLWSLLIFFQAPILNSHFKSSHILVAIESICSILFWWLVEVWLPWKFLILVGVQHQM